jgi:hypothetical protein
VFMVCCFVSCVYLNTANIQNKTNNFQIFLFKNVCFLVKLLKINEKNLRLNLNICQVKGKKLDKLKVRR